MSRSMTWSYCKRIGHGFWKILDISPCGEKEKRSLNTPKPSINMSCMGHCKKSLLDFGINNALSEKFAQRGKQIFYHGVCDMLIINEEKK